MELTLAKLENNYRLIKVGTKPLSVILFDLRSFQMTQSSRECTVVKQMPVLECLRFGNNANDFVGLVILSTQQQRRNLLHFANRNERTNERTSGALQLITSFQIKNQFAMALYIERKKNWRETKSSPNNNNPLLEE